MNALSRSCFTSVYILHKDNTPYFRTINIHCICHYFYDIKAHSPPSCHYHNVLHYVKKNKKNINEGQPAQTDDFLITINVN